jgi:hypothetical protein
VVRSRSAALVESSVALIGPSVSVWWSVPLTSAKPPQ